MTIFSQIFLPFLIIYYVYVLLRLSTGNMRNKKQLFKSMIPFYRVFQNIITEYKNLDES